MKKTKRIYGCIFSVAVFLVALLQSCKEENVEDLFFNDQVAAKSYYLNSVLPILNSKCFSCHTYHASSGTRYDTFAKAAAVAEEMVERTSSAHPNIIMPPPSATPLTEEEKRTFQQFFYLVKGSGGSSIATAGDDSQEDYGIAISWTAYKFPDVTSRVGVSGTFDKAYITYKKKEAADIYEFLAEAEILIPTNSVNVGDDPLKSSNVKNSFFSFFTPVIHGRVTAIDSSTKKARVKFTMNGLSQEVTFDMEEVENDLVFSGQIQDIGYFNSQVALDALQRACGEYHQDKVWPDISLRAEIKNFGKFAQAPL